MKKKMSFFKGILLTYFIIGQGEVFSFGSNHFRRDKYRPSENNCLSKVSCTYSRMPLQRQGAIMLKWYLNEKESLSVKSDPGWCGAVAGMMAVYGLRVHNPNVKWDDWPDNVPVSKIKKSNRYYGVWKIGQSFKTNFENGGTYGHHAADALRNMWDKVKGYSWKHFSNERYLPIWSTKTLKEDIYKKKHVSYIGVSKEEVKIVRSLSTSVRYDKEVKERFMNVGYYEVPVKREGGHALVINGYDGGKIILYDPWGRIYTVDIVNYLYAVEKGFISNKTLSGSHRSRFSHHKKIKRDWLNFNHFIENAGLKKYHNILNTKTNIGIR